MRLAPFLALTGGLLTSPCLAEALPTKDAQVAVGAAVAMALVQVDGCPHYRLNRERLSAYLDANNLTRSIIMERYLTFATALAKRLNTAYNTNPGRLCSELWDMFGDRGILPQLMERK